MLGFLNLDKPSGWTSHDCVAKVRKILGIKRIGHGGTLDPMATGVLPIAVGNATRLLSYLPTRKIYRARVRFGITTTTDDGEGEVLERFPVEGLNLERVEPYLGKFIGRIEQVPPMYSAISIDGRRLYEMARKGETIEVPARIVEIESIGIIGWYGGELPELELRITCGGGTYIRSIARDLGRLLGTGGTLVNLIREESCGMNLSYSVNFDTLLHTPEPHILLTPPKQALQHLSLKKLNGEQIEDWYQGRRFAIGGDSEKETLAVEGENGKFLGIAELEKGVIKPKVVLA